MIIELFQGEIFPDKWFYTFKSNGHVLCTSSPFTTKGIAKRSAENLLHKIEK